MMHRVMGIDIETYSSVDLTDAGVYAYTEAPDFDILLISYIFDDWGEDDVRTIDCFDADPDMMAEFVEALTDPRIVKTAFNANFERTCLAKWLNKPMPPEEWRCTMVKALTLGLPGNLAGAGEALGLPAEKLKDPQGKALIQFFSKPCKPTRVNGQRTRNLPEHDPAKWQLYKNYNRQDVVTEQEILRKLSIYKTPEDEQALWSLDQHMNDNGVKLDIPMVEKIVAYDNQRRQELQEEAQELTGLKNPNSLAQLKRWLAEQGVEMDSVTKDTIAEALKQPGPWPGERPESAGDPHRPRQDQRGQVQHDAGGAMPGSPAERHPSVLRGQPLRPLGRPPWCRRTTWPRTRCRIWLWPASWRPRETSTPWAPCSARRPSSSPS